MMKNEIVVFILKKLFTFVMGFALSLDSKGTNCYSNFRYSLFTKSITKRL